MKSRVEIMIEDLLQMMKDLAANPRALLPELQTQEKQIYTLETEIEALENRGLWSWLSRTAKSVAQRLS